LWSSSEQGQYQGRWSEICWLINHAIDTDDGELLAASFPIIYHLNKFCVASRTGPSKLPPIRYPPVSQGFFTTFRGGGFDERCAEAYKVGKKMRLPGVVATSEDPSTAQSFMQMASDRGFPAIQWTLFVPERCMHVNYLDSRFSLIRDESEWTLAPYTVVEVMEVRWSEVGAPAVTTLLSPHRITFKVSLDNISGDEDLPLAPWR